jgi:phosphate starvation-inducible PhoH-like protein
VSRRLADPLLRVSGGASVAVGETPAAVQELDLGDGPEVLRNLFGAGNANLKAIERVAGVRIGQRGGALRLEGPRDSVDLVVRLIGDLASMSGRGTPIGPQEIEQALRLLAENPALQLEDLNLEPVLVSSRNRTISPKGLAQRAYVRAIRAHDIVFGLGPAGTGKTYLAMATAVAALAERRVKRIVLARPAVEAGERLGFLPGDLAEKVNPYLRPLYDALNEMMDDQRAATLIERGVVEVAPLAFMRGRTLNDAFVILDEAQNTSSEQMKMFLTRLGFSSQAVITGDPTQTDLPPGQTSGLLEAVDLLKGIEGIAFVHFSEQDVVRHPLVRRVIQAYEKK